MKIVVSTYTIQLNIFVHGHCQHTRFTNEFDYLLRMCAAYCYSLALWESSVSAELVFLIHSIYQTISASLLCWRHEIGICIANRCSYVLSVSQWSESSIVRWTNTYDSRANDCRMCAATHVAIHQSSMCYTLASWRLHQVDWNWCNWVCVWKRSSIGKFHFFRTRLCVATAFHAPNASNSFALASPNNWRGRSERRTVTIRPVECEERIIFGQSIRMPVRQR